MSFFRLPKIDVVRQRNLFIGISLALMLPGLVFMALNIQKTRYHAPLHLGIDFVGGTLIEYGFEKPVQQGQVAAIQQIFEQAGAKEPVVQLQQQKVANASPTQSPKDSPEPSVASIASIRTESLSPQQVETIQAGLRRQFGAFQLLQKNAIGPTMAAELFKSGLLALVLAYLLIVGYLTVRFQLDFALAAIVALLHDTIFIFGAFATLGYLFGTEINSLFVTGVLTVVGFSVHDTIVVFDRLRENIRLYYGKTTTFGEIVNISVNQTLARSINTSLTAVLALLSLFFLGGVTTRDFVLCMLLGIITGTFSSICVASLIVAWWRDRNRPPTQPEEVPVDPAPPALQTA